MPTNPRPLVIAKVTDAESWLTGKNLINNSDARLTDARTPVAHNHIAANISDLTEAVQDIVGAFMGAGSSMNVTYNDTANTLTVAFTGTTGTPYDPEAVRDTIGAALIPLGLITLNVNDAADTITIGTSATQNQTDAFLLSRANHTGTQAASTVTGLATVATTGAWGDITGKPTFGTSAYLNVPSVAGAIAGATESVRGDDPRFGAGATTSSGGNTVFASNTTAVTLAAVNTEYAIGTVTITPKLATSGILLQGRANFTTGTGTAIRTVTLRIRRGTTNTGTLVGIAVPMKSPGSASTYFPAMLFASDLPSVTTAQVYTLWASCDTITNTASVMNQSEFMAVEILGVQASTGGSGTLADNSVTTAKLVNAAVTTDKLADLSVTEGKIVAALLTKINNALQTGTPVPDSSLPQATFNGWLAPTTVNGVKTYALDNPVIYAAVTAYMQTRSGYVGDGSKVWLDNFTWGTGGSSTGGGTTNPPAGTPTTFTTFATDNATYSSGTFTITNPATKSSAKASKKLVAGTIGSMQGVSGNIWIGFGTDPTYQPNAVTELRFAMRFDRNSNKIVVFCNTAAAQYQSDEVQGRPATTIVRPGVKPDGSWGPYYSEDGGTTWNLVVLANACPKSATEDTYAAIVTTPDDSNRTNVTGLAYLNLV
jgi:hypothetical protein